MGSGLRSLAGAFGLKLFGARAVESMCMEKGFLHWRADILTEFDPFETSLDRFVKPGKPDFIGKEALLKRQAEGPQKKLVMLKLDATHAPAHPGASLMQADQVVGTVTSGDWGHRTGLNLAYAFVSPSFRYPVRIP
ncbi:glycine cleavage T C-terminal barrel domain-containing protein [Salaquimonas pukyongi]|uniref:glycine cleavage T C-terminal barrel domain-containing protein n=1 Tax=Salaquimonas pukyongi TaxID=2712698 RepID=UPI001967875B|nr:glycine cleavage T C-terminal barrel domain-containing protein [Salaquimonas pukyongi]